MKRLLVFVLLLAQSCHLDSHPSENKPLAAVDSIKPKVNIKVNKKYDDKGKLIQFDSSYSSSYIFPGMKDSLHLGTDSMYGRFKSWYFNNYDQSMNKRMNDIFFTDSLFRYDLLNPDYFQKRFELNLNRYQEMFQQMDSLKNQYFNQSYPGSKLNKNKK